MLMQAGGEGSGERNLGSVEQCAAIKGQRAVVVKVLNERSWSVYRDMTNGQSVESSVVKRPNVFEGVVRVIWSARSQENGRCF